MTVFVDDSRTLAERGGLTGLWSRLSADDVDELHAFARQAGAPRDWFIERCRAEPGGQCPHWHYRVNEWTRGRAVQLGAVPVDARLFDATMEARRRLRP